MSGTVHPPVSWAQRRDLLYVIIDVECKDIEHSVTNKSFTFKGVNVLDPSKKYEVTLNFLHPIDPQRVTSKNIGRCLEFTIYKKEEGPFWPSLTTDKTKLHFLKANFSKWKSESEDEDDMVIDGDRSSDMLIDRSNWNNMFDVIGMDDEDSDDNIPSLSQNDEDDDDDEDKEKDKKEKDEK